VNFADPDVTNTREPSSEIEIGLFGSERVISANNLPGTSTFPYSLMSAAKCALLDVSKSDPDRNTSSPLASMTIPSSAVIIGRVDKERDTQLTPSANADCSTVNFTPHLFPSGCV
jgi:hypothetical protein